jgi:hypothetical protein
MAIGLPEAKWLLFAAGMTIKDDDLPRRDFFKRILGRKRAKLPKPKPVGDKFIAGMIVQKAEEKNLHVERRAFMRNVLELGLIGALGGLFALFVNDEQKILKLNQIIEEVKTAAPPGMTTTPDWIDFAVLTSRSSASIGRMEMVKDAGGTVVNPSYSPDGTNWRDLRSEQAASYVVFTDATDSNKVKARNGITGAVDYSNASFATVLQNVANAIEGSAIGAGLIELAAGVFDLGTTTVNFNHPITVRGQGRGDNTWSSYYPTKIMYSGTGTAFQFNTGGDQVLASGLRLEHFSLINTAAMDTHGVLINKGGIGRTVGIGLANACQCRLEDVHVDAFNKGIMIYSYPGTGVNLNYCEWNDVIGCYVKDCNFGIALEGFYTDASDFGHVFATTIIGCEILGYAAASIGDVGFFVNYAPLTRILSPEASYFNNGLTYNACIYFANSPSFYIESPIFDTCLNGVSLGPGNHLSDGCIINPTVDSSVTNMFNDNGTHYGLDSGSTFGQPGQSSFLLMRGGNLQAFKNSTDANPTISLDTNLSAIKFGAGGPLDTYLARNNGALQITDAAGNLQSLSVLNLAADNLIAAYPGAVIGIQTTGTDNVSTGTLGSIVLPVKTTSGAPTDAQGGNLDGCIVLNSSEMNLYVRSGGIWHKVALT